MNNIIQIYGLPRSGTNFLEWSIQTYFNTDYTNVRQVCDVKGLPEYGIEVALKHSYPSLLHSDYCIVIYKELHKWKDSVQRRGVARGYKITNEVCETVYHNYLRVANSLDKSKSIVVKHEDACREYESLIKTVSNKFNIPIRDDVDTIQRPTGYMNKAGAEALPSDTKEFKL